MQLAPPAMADDDQQPSRRPRWLAWLALGVAAIICAASLVGLLNELWPVARTQLWQALSPLWPAAAAPPQDVYNIHATHVYNNDIVIDACTQASPEFPDSTLDWWELAELALLLLKYWLANQLRAAKKVPGWSCRCCVDRTPWNESVLTRMVL